MSEFSTANNPERYLLSVKAFQKIAETFEMKKNKKTKTGQQDACHNNELLFKKLKLVQVLLLNQKEYTQ